MTSSWSHSPSLTPEFALPILYWHGFATQTTILDEPACINLVQYYFALAVSCRLIQLATRTVTIIIADEHFLSIYLAKKCTIAENVLEIYWNPFSFLRPEQKSAAWRWITQVSWNWAQVSQMQTILSGKINHENLNALLTFLKASEYLNVTDMTVLRYGACNSQRNFTRCSPTSLRSWQDLVQ